MLWFEHFQHPASPMSSPTDLLIHNLSSTHASIHPIKYLTPSYQTIRYVDSANNSLHTAYLMPPSSYEYTHPEGTGKGAPPFYSCWFLGKFPPAEALTTALATPHPLMASKANNGNGEGKNKKEHLLSPHLRALGEGRLACVILSSFAELVKRGYVIL